MSNETVYVAAFEVGFEPGCQLYGEGKGAFVWCFVKGPSAAEAEGRARAALATDGYAVKVREWIDEAANLDWEGDAAEMQSLVAEAAQSADPVYSTFNVYVDE
jgi:hypothetical protein